MEEIRHAVCATKEAKEKITKINLRIMKQFLCGLAESGKSQRTQQLYRIDLQFALVWNAQHNKNKRITLWTREDVLRFQKWMVQERGMSPQRVIMVRKVLSRLYEYEKARHPGDPQYSNPIRFVDAPSSDARFKHVASVLHGEEVERLLSALVEKKKYLWACYVALGVASGCKRRELQRFQAAQLPAEGEEPEFFKAVGFDPEIDGRWKIYHYINWKFCAPYVRLWQEEMRRRGIESRWLFPQMERPGEPVTEEMVYDWARKWQKQHPGILSERFCTDAMRPLYLENLLRVGVPETVIRKVKKYWILTSEEEADLLRRFQKIEGVIAPKKT